MNRREFFKLAAVFSGCAAFRMAWPNALLSNVFAKEEAMMIHMDNLLDAMETKDTAEADRRLKELFDDGWDAWEIHLSLFHFVQRVLNPPFINPHLPKTYAIIRELKGYLQTDEIPPLIGLEVIEYTRRSKLEKLKMTEGLKQTIAFGDIESAVREQDRGKTAALMASFHTQAGPDELSRRLLLLGSEYLSNSLGHSISCTAFILREMSVRTGEDLWPVFTLLADYFCKGKFYRTPDLGDTIDVNSAGYIPHLLLMATEGGGIVNLHHTITLYALERVRHLFSEKEYGHMMSAMIAFMGDKEEKQPAFDFIEAAKSIDYSMFNETFSGMDVNSVTGIAAGMMTSSQGRRRLGCFLIRAVCEAYQGDYDPHYITGLGSALWAIDRYWDQGTVAMNALYQYLDYLFNGLRPQNE
jgi:hypothetical protein